MLIIKCPFCGLRPEIEFRYAGEAHVRRPQDPSAVSDETWTAFLHVRSNPAGEHAERWHHQHGCRRYFNGVRNTVTDDFSATYPAGAHLTDAGAEL